MSGLDAEVIGLRDEVARLQSRLADAAAHREQDRQAAVAEQDRLTFELGHRIKNTLSMVQALASQTLRGEDTKEAALETFSGRIIALARASDAILKDSWTTTAIGAVTRNVLAPFAHPARALTVNGPEVAISANGALALAMALYELAVNAQRHGAWSRAEGRVAVRWTLDQTVEDGILTWAWTETGMSQLEAPAKYRFGLRLTEQSLKSAFGRDVSLDFASDGFICRAQAPVSVLTA